MPLLEYALLKTFLEDNSGDSTADMVGRRRLKCAETASALVSQC